MTDDAGLRAIGLDIVKGVDFMQAVLSETQVLLKDVERQMERSSLRSVSQAIVYLDAQQNIEAPRAWLQASLGRIFSTGAHKTPSDELVVVEVHLEPSKNHDEPFVLLGVVRSNQARPPSEWTAAYSGSEWLTEILPSAYEPGTLAEVEALDGRVFKGFRSARIQTWYLTRMTGSAAIQTNMMEALKVMRKR